MARVGGQIPLSSIGVIFVLVFAGMYGAVQFAEGDLLSENPADIREREVANALWTIVSSWRADRNLQSATRVERVRIEAQETAELLESEGRSIDAVAAGPASKDSTSLPNGHAECDQLATSVAVPPPGYDDVATKTVSMQVSEDVAAKAFAKLRTVDSAGVLDRSSRSMNGVGVAIDGDRAYVVYRSCQPHRMSP